MLEVKEDKRAVCISCCDKSKSSRRISISRDKGIFKGDSIISFDLCDECLSKLAREFTKFS